MPQILIFGDSITYGACDIEGGWVQRLRKFLDRKTLSDPSIYFSIYNLGVCGDTTDDLLERFEFETEQRLYEGEETTIIFDIGMNDSQFVNSHNNLRIAPEKFKKNVQNLINLTKKFSSKIIFIGLTPVDETKTTPVSWDNDHSYKNEYIGKYNDVIESICKKNNIYFVEIIKELSRFDYKNLLEDGVHPNSAGHQKIFEIVKEFLIKNKIIF